MPQNDPTHDPRPNILVLCMDQWDARMELPEGVEFPALERLEAQGVTYEQRVLHRPGLHALARDDVDGRARKADGVMGQHELRLDPRTLAASIPTDRAHAARPGLLHGLQGQMAPLGGAEGEDALERYGFSDYQQWGEMFGAPLQGEMLDGTAAFETVDWLENTATRLEQPWLLVCSLVNPHDIMFLQTDPIETPAPERRDGRAPDDASSGSAGSRSGGTWRCRTTSTTITSSSRYGVRHYKEYIDLNYGRMPDDRTDLWLEAPELPDQRMRLVDCGVPQDPRRAGSARSCGRTPSSSSPATTAR